MLRPMTPRDLSLLFLHTPCHISPYPWYGWNIRTAPRPLYKRTLALRLLRYYLASTAAFRLNRSPDGPSVEFGSPHDSSRRRPVSAYSQGTHTQQTEFQDMIGLFTKGRPRGPSSADEKAPEDTNPDDISILFVPSTLSLFLVVDVLKTSSGLQRRG